MKSNISIVSSLFLVALCLGSLLRAEGLCVLGKRTRVFVYNQLPSQLTAHCGSGSDDHGLRLVLPRDNMNWGFCAYPNTLYFCSLGWNGKQASFEAFKGKFLKSVESKYNWVAKEDGIYFFANDSPQLMVKKVDWQ